SSWTNIGTVTGNALLALSIIRAPDGTTMVGSGSFSAIGAVSTTNIAQYVGGAWYPLPGTAIDRQVNAIAYAAGGNLYAGLVATGLSEQIIAMFTGSSWLKVGPYTTLNIASATAITPNPVGAGVYVSGQFDIN